MKENIIVQSKISQPIIPLSVIKISSFTEAIEKLYEGRTVYISAPAGCGKTTNIAFWIQSNSIPCAWVSLDESDDSSNRFIKCLSHSLSKCTSQKPSELEGDAETLMDSFLLNIYNLESPLALVIDDFHYIKKKEVMNMVYRIMQNKPKNLYLIISGRSPMPDIFLGLLTRQKVEIITQQTLAFGTEDIRLFLKRKNIKADEQQVMQCFNITHGWVLGLVAIALSLGNTEKIEEITDKARHEYIHRFIMDEIWNRMDSKTQEFLCKTSILDEFSLTMAEAVTELEESREILECLYKKGAFISKFGSHGKWYRYHQIFKEFIFNQAVFCNYSISELHYKAAVYYKNKNDLQKALKHFEISGHKNEMLCLIKENLKEFLNVIEPEKVIEILDSLENYDVFSNIEICICYEWALQQIRKPAKAKNFINVIEEKLKNQPEDISTNRREQIQLEISAMKFPFLTIENDINEIISCLNDMYLLDVKNPIIYNPNAIANLYGNEYTLRDTASGFYGRNNLYLELIDKFHSEKHTTLKKQMMSYTSNKTALAEVLYEKNNITDALKLLPGCIEDALKEKNYKTYLPAMLCLSNIQQSKGEFADAIVTLKICEDVLKEHSEHLALQTLSAYKTRIDILLSNDKDVTKWENEAKINAYDDVSNISRHSLYQYLTLLLLLTKKKRWVIAKLLSDKINRMLAKFPDLVYMSQALFLDIYISLKCDQLETLDAKIDQLINLSNEHGYVRTFIEFGYPFLEVIQYALKVKKLDIDSVRMAKNMEIISLNFTKKISEEIFSGQKLTQREKDILSLLTKNLTNQEIADIMFLSLQTIKNHTHSIYKKLNASGRSQAIDRAEILGLI